MVDYAFAGAGWVAGVHGLAVGAQRGGRVVSVASRTRARAESFAADVGADAVSYEDLPAGGDIVVVATPPRRHAVDALRSLSAGATVVVEKPLCATLDDADRLVRVVEAGGVLVYAENLLFAPPVTRALEEIGDLGSLTHLSARAMQPRPTWGSFTERSWGGGVLFDLGVHPLALVVRAARGARPVGVRAVFEASDDVDVEDRASVSLRFHTGLTALVEVSWRETEPIWDLQAASEGGVVVLEMLPEITLERSGTSLELPAPTVGDDVPPQLEQFGYIDQLREAEVADRSGRVDPISDVHLGRDLLDIVCAASVSARDGGADVALPYDGPRDLAPIELYRPA